MLQRFGQVRVVQVEIGASFKLLGRNLRLSRSRMTSSVRLLVSAAARYWRWSAVTGVCHLCPFFFPDHSGANPRLHIILSINS